jgi:hypothetical protein
MNEFREGTYTPLRGVRTSPPVPYLSCGKPILRKRTLHFFGGGHLQQTQNRDKKTGWTASSFSQSIGKILVNLTIAPLIALTFLRQL